MTITVNERYIKPVCWNTGRPYTDEGQRIAAVVASGCVYFYDIDRGINGWYEAPTHPLSKWLPLEDSVMTKYDAGEYTQGLPDAIREALAIVAKRAPVLAQKPVPRPVGVY